VLAAAVLHASWNAMVHTAVDRLVGFAAISAVYAAVGGAAVLASPSLGSHHFRFAVLSAALHVAYTMLLLASYQAADLSRAYPLSRGTGVALVGVASAFLPRSPLGPAVVLGVGLVVVGLLGVTLAGPRLARADARGIVAALATGVAIAGYTVVDGLAVSGGADVVAYAGWMFLLQSPAMPLLALCRRGRAIVRLTRRQVLLGLGGGVVSLAAYGLVLLAQTSGALAAVAALRELSIAIGVVLGAVVLRETAARARLLPALLIAVGAVVLALGVG
jgi:drug/metabolite transporter (DMT)-like permease